MKTRHGTRGINLLCGFEKQRLNERTKYQLWPFLSPAVCLEYHFPLTTTTTTTTSTTTTTTTTTTSILCQTEENMLLCVDG
ncbi:hypothetical protein E2C01_007162 [Portunus trituberculatus]|uniref:Uncharacterized protein n=1 Tax=Portunus trituberculatus TaxID=210409 RepID=A0A5B7CX35_PORTR|nr:hypothetical protein [Portunus trituberculatus]